MNEHFYGVGRVRALEARMLTQAQIARMVAAADFESAFGVLSETPYAENLPKLEPAFDFEDLCDLELLSLKNLMDHLAPENETLKALFRRYDYLNLKILMRSYFSQFEGTKLYSKAGTISFDNLRLYIFEGIKEIDDKEILEAIDDAKRLYEQNKDPQSLDLFLDKHYYSYLKQICQSSPSPLIKDMVDHQIDLTNIKTLLRAQGHKKLEEALLEPGFIDKDILLDLPDKTPQEIISSLSFTIYFPEIAEGIEFFAKNKSFYLMEKLMDDFILNRFRKAKYLSSGIEPLVGFYLAKEAEIKTLRFILISKKNYIGSERIRERLRVSYV
ncbi:MAG: V-type ATPase subunit [Candidatus Margulisiibacteriota bacterium]